MGESGWLLCSYPCILGSSLLSAGEREERGMCNYALTSGLPCSLLLQVTRPRTQSCSYKSCLLRNKKTVFTSFHLLKWLFKRVICIILHFIIWVLHFTPNTYRNFSPGLYGLPLFLVFLSVTSRIQNHVRGKGALLWSNGRSPRTVAPGKVLSCHLRPGRTQSNPRLWAPRAVNPALLNEVQPPLGLEEMRIWAHR